ncbi:hypothetical protein MESS2_p110013 [Mesorhizobium metallidurans STM 2683]|uniref:Uncharacterized protein n=1 Tax=Mesorhizobium metallidurans STM 2683 TaxID=1297569 RepID=M5EWK9_9HYPH|nr:hypothetical protein MESS2_p110013 [Mesorhizobium metallidurans STM 2683]
MPFEPSKRLTSEENFISDFLDV